MPVSSRPSAHSRKMKLSSSMLTEPFEVHAFSATALWLEARHGPRWNQRASISASVPSDAKYASAQSKARATHEALVVVTHDAVLPRSASKSFTVKSSPH